MKLVLKYFSLHPSTDGGPASIGASLDVVFSTTEFGVEQISGNIGITFGHPTPEDLTFHQVEKLATQRILDAL